LEGIVMDCKTHTHKYTSIYHPLCATLSGKGGQGGVGVNNEGVKLNFVKNRVRGAVLL